MKKQSTYWIHFFTAFFLSLLLSGCSNSTKETDAQTLNAKTPWRIGEMVVEGDMPLMAGAWKLGEPLTFVPAYRIFLGMTPEGYYLIQDFYKDKNTQATSPYRVADPTDVTAAFYNEKDAGMQYSIDGELRSWYPDGTLESEVSFEKGVLRGASYRYYDNARLMLEINHETGRMVYYNYHGKLLGLR
ncbi:MAG: toxin-antitoxin system YwqK family antitoxin [Saezia sp.]